MGLIPAHAGKTARHRAAGDGWRAHPRSRGENQSSRQRQRRRRGSSPLTRGKRVQLHHAGDRAGLIPAHAGKTSTSLNSWSGTRAHPRSRGENNLVANGVHLRSGSSPLTRGKPLVVNNEVAIGGLIPAHAGKTPWPPGSKGRVRAHPRSRGENGRRCWQVRRRRGSSPLTRGKPAIDDVALAAGRLIPAHAGKTVGAGLRIVLDRAHPRSRGENLRYIDGELTRPGSSPLTRGKLLNALAPLIPVRLIPAHAGKTGRQTAHHGYESAHPRSRGENPPKRASHARSAGSSPLTRGKLSAEKPDFLTGRLIPAHAGKTSIKINGWSLLEAHPRSRGENAEGGDVIAAPEGSSPLTRGKLIRASRGREMARLIPAHAGKTLSRS